MASSTVVAPFISAEEIENINATSSHKILVIVWNLFQKRNATRAVLLKADEKGFEVEVHLSPGVFSKAGKKVLRHKYEIEGVHNKEKFNDYFENMFHRSNAPSVPLGMAALWCWLSLFAWMLLLARFFARPEEITDKNAFFGFYLLCKASMALFPERSIALYASFVFCFAHALESLYVASLCLAMKFRLSATLSWTVLTLMAGFPVMNRLILLNSLRLNEHQRDEKQK